MIKVPSSATWHHQNPTEKGYVLCNHSGTVPKNCIVGILKLSIPTWCLCWGRFELEMVKIYNERFEIFDKQWKKPMVLLFNPSLLFFLILISITICTNDYCLVGLWFWLLNNVFSIITVLLSTTYSAGWNLAYNENRGWKIGTGCTM